MRKGKASRTTRGIDLVGYFAQIIIANLKEDIAKLRILS